MNNNNPVDKIKYRLDVNGGQDNFARSNHGLRYMHGAMSMNLPPLSYLERYRNEGTRTYSKHSDYSEADLRYQPGSKTSEFGVHAFMIPRQFVNVYTANPPESLRSTYADEEQPLFCVHPQVIESCGDEPYVSSLEQVGIPVASITVEPTSSTRTLSVKGTVPHALKLHFPFRVSRYGRKMRDEVIEQAVAVSQELESGVTCFDESFAFLREVIGVSFTNLDPTTQRPENWGYLVRDMKPFPGVGEDLPLVPGFALYGTDRFDPEKQPLLYDLIGEREMLNWVLDNLMLPIVRHWVQCYRSFGFMLEPHGQNVLLEIDENYEVSRIIHRDLSVGIDMRRRADNALDSDHLNSYNRMDYGEFCSIAYDMFMGSHFFERVIECCTARNGNLGAEDFRAPCRELFAELFPDHDQYLPRTVHYFSEKRDRFNKPLYEDTGKKPAWRP